eukprot:TRINITY_DN2315_c0_g3_i1.p1 TRINITY_DN2315_c0_g3~~TRINITY_DN2315_c0_g3_i1.p1  ORF type:complete len:461 (+),score=48.25 TRINITY_DN2315_c0_g3_i1:54-1385(+)
MASYTGIFFLVLAVVVASARADCADIAGNWTYVGKGQSCDENTLWCKNFLYCAPASINATARQGSCQEAVVGAPCIAAFQCGDYLQCNKSNVCDFAPNCLSAGEGCDYDGECTTNSCENNTCVGLALNKTCTPPNPSTNEYVDPCHKDSYCSTTNEVCTTSLRKGDDCTVESFRFNNSFISYPHSIAPNFVCESGTSCLPTPGTSGPGNWTCEPYYALQKGDRCVGGTAGAEYSGCEPGLFCGYSPKTNDYFCQSFGQRHEGSSCNATFFASLTGEEPQCKWGEICDCFTSSSSDAGVCTKYINTDCGSEMDHLVDCIKEHSCPFDPSPLSGNYLFAGPSLFPYSCVSNKCGTKYAQLVCCQNNEHKGAPYTAAWVPEWSNEDLECGSGDRSPSSDGDHHHYFVTFIIVVLVLCVVGAVVGLGVFFRTRVLDHFRSNRGYEGL